ncbi:MAG: hypothetical protein V8Q93_14310 [Blautia faecis]
MAFDQKLRTLYLMEILLERTDDEHMLKCIGVVHDSGSGMAD